MKVRSALGCLLVCFCLGTFRVPARAQRHLSAGVFLGSENTRLTATPVFDHNEKFAWSNMTQGNSFASLPFTDQTAAQWPLMNRSTLRVVSILLIGFCGVGLVVFLTPKSRPLAVIAGIASQMIGWMLCATGLPKPPPVYDITGDYRTFLEAIVEQQAIDASRGRAGSDDIVECPEDARIVGVPIDQVASDPLVYWRYATMQGRCHSGKRFIRLTVVRVDDKPLSRAGQTPIPPKPFSVVVCSGHIGIVWQWTISPLPSMPTRQPANINAAREQLVEMGTMPTIGVAAPPLPTPKTTSGKP